VGGTERMAVVNGQNGKPLTVKQEQFFQVIVKGLSRAEEGGGHHYTAEANAGQVEGDSQGAGVTLNMGHSEPN